MSTTFAAATAVIPAGHGAYQVELVPEYAIGGAKPHGDYLLDCLGRAALAAAREAGSGHEHVIAAGAQYFRSPNVGPARIDTTVLRAGRTATQVSAGISYDGAPGVQAQFTLAPLPAGGRPAPVPAAPPPRGRGPVRGRRRAGGDAADQPVPADVPRRPPGYLGAL